MLKERKLIKIRFCFQIGVRLFLFILGVYFVRDEEVV